MWSGENPRAIRPHEQHRQFSNKLWAGILSERLIDHHILLARVSGKVYLSFSRKHLRDFWKVSFNTWFQLDAAPP
jgi:hypothetical protein